MTTLDERISRSAPLAALKSKKRHLLQPSWVFFGACYCPETSFFT
jgi:hypothetical protein